MTVGYLTVCAFSVFLGLTCLIKMPSYGVLSGNGIITSSEVEEAMKKTDRKHYCPHNAYQDAPQSIGNVAWCRDRVCPCRTLHTVNCYTGKTISFLIYIVVVLRL